MHRERYKHVKQDNVMGHISKLKLLCTRSWMTETEWIIKFYSGVRLDYAVDGAYASYCSRLCT